MKILAVHSTEQFSGGERVSIDIISGTALRVSWSIFLPAAPTPEARTLYGAVPCIFPSKRGMAARLAALRRAVRKENPSIIHCHGTRAALWVRLVSLTLRKRPKIVYTVHGLHIARKSFLIRSVYLFAERLLNHFVDALICVSGADKDQVLSKRLIAPAKITIIRNGIDMAKFAASSSDTLGLRGELGLAGRFSVLSVARLHPQKDVATVIRAAERLRDHEDVLFLLAGDGPLRSQLESYVEEKKLVGTVRFLGFRADTPALMHSADVVVLSSWWEGLPLVPFEAGAAHRPVLVSNVAGSRETVKDGETGFLFVPGSDVDLAEKILRLKSDASLRERMGEAGYQMVSQSYTIQKMADAYYSVYTTLA